MERISEVAIENKPVTSSPSKAQSMNDSSSIGQITPIKSEAENCLSLRIESSENDSSETSANCSNGNGLLTFSTPKLFTNPAYAAFQLYRNLSNSFSTPNSIPKITRKPRVNFRSIDDIVYGGKSSDEEHDSGYQSIMSSSNASPETTTKVNLFNKSPIVETSANIDCNNDENKDHTKKKATVENSNQNPNKKVRSTFTDHQKWMLEQYFRKNPYPDPRETEDLSKQLVLPENVIKVWFQNKRSRDKQRKLSSQKSVAQATVNLENNFANQLSSLQFYSALGSIELNKMLYGSYC